MSLRIYGNRLLKTLPGQETRPTTGKVRAAVFNIWQERLKECRWLDLCTGSGAMGAEALARGVAMVVGIEKSPKACSIILQNWQAMAQPDQKFRLLRGDVVKKLAQLGGEQFDLIYFDPPYSSNLYTPVLDLIAQGQILRAGGELAVEHDPKLLMPGVKGFSICRQKNYGNTAITFFTQGTRGEL